MKTEIEELALAIKDFEEALPDWWWSVGHCSVSRDASCGPDRNGIDRELLTKHTDIYDAGFHCDDKEGTLATALRDVLAQALEAKAKWY